MLKGLQAEILTSADNRKKCGGIGNFETTELTTLVILHVAHLTTPSPASPAFVMLEKHGRLGLYPADPRTGKPLPGWFMHDGRFAKTSDSRFPHAYPLPIYDRQENHFTPFPDYQD